MNDIDGSITNDTNASLRKNNGSYVTPYQDSASQAGSNREEAFQIKTNSQGEATFTVTGKNTKATPVVFVDENKNNRFEQTELHATAGAVEFKGVQSPYTLSFDRSENFVAALSDEHGTQNPVKYTVKVLTENGQPYKGGTVKVGIQQNHDASLTNNTPAKIAATKDGVYNADQVVSVVTNDKGEATFYVKSAVDNSKATPIAWIDLNSAGNVDNVGNDKLEDGEPFAVAPTVTFLKSVVVAPEYALNKPFAGPFITGDTMTWTSSLLNQSGNVSETAGIRYATFTVKNTSDVIQKINPSLVDETGLAYDDKTITYNGSTQTAEFVNGQEVTMEPGTTVTIHGVARTYNSTNVTSVTKDAKLNVGVPAKSGSLEVSSQVSTVKNKANGDTCNDNNTYDYKVEEADFLADVQKVTVPVTGTVVGFEVKDNIDGGTNYGRIVIKADGTNDYKVYHYGKAGETTKLGTDGQFANNGAAFTAATYDQIENALSLDDRLQLQNVTSGVAGTLLLANTDNSNKKQAVGNGAAPEVSAFTITSAKTNGTDKVEEVVVKFNKDVTQAQLNRLATTVGSPILSGVTVNGYNLQSPTLNADGTVTFKLSNPTTNTAALANATLTVDAASATVLGGEKAVSATITDAVAPVQVGDVIVTDTDGVNGFDTATFTFSETLAENTIDPADFRFYVSGAAAPGYVSGKAFELNGNKLVVEFDGSYANLGNRHGQ
ncbi:hypothetical protein SporoP37_12260 [Sporosarcina sp. P37]|uniref:hypothetical protein n=1 Tax=unclassified Sporosarcina TaxID=2647733 RepID=UPI000A17E84B|nr:MULTISPECIES: hypothetical protein [unclassified Sporosarcina]ARK25352.1 hypothetical protein SporoP37_12260 [Sporosarcina sp. P37]PID17150.1 hypothetical protein CSV62_15100 [Sporosarcina sp. P35]